MSKKNVTQEQKACNVFDLLKKHIDTNCPTEPNWIKDLAPVMAYGKSAKACRSMVFIANVVVPGTKDLITDFERPNNHIEYIVDGYEREAAVYANIDLQKLTQCLETYKFICERQKEAKQNNDRDALDVWGQNVEIQISHIRICPEYAKVIVRAAKILESKEVKFCIMGQSTWAPLKVVYDDVMAAYLAPKFQHGDERDFEKTIVLNSDKVPAFNLSK